jgi:hypothetical protein
MNLERFTRASNLLSRIGELEFRLALYKRLRDRGFDSKDYRTTPNILILKSPDGKDHEIRLEEPMKSIIFGPLVELTEKELESLNREFEAL